MPDQEPDELLGALEHAEAAAADPPPAKQYRGIVDMLEDTDAWQRRHLLDAMRPGTDQDRFMGGLITAIRNNPNLRELGATAEGRRSIMYAVTRCATLGLEPNNELGHAYLIAFKRYKNTDRERMELQMIVGYKGYLKLAAESGNLKEINVHEVYQKDRFSIVYGTTADAGVRHEPMLLGPDGEPMKKGENGPIYCYYISVQFHDGGQYYTHMTLDQIEDRRQRSSAVQAGVSTPWDTDPVAMSKKTLVRAAVPYLRLDARTAEALDMDEKIVNADGDGFEYLETTGTERELTTVGGPPNVDGPTD